VAQGVGPAFKPQYHTHPQKTLKIEVPHDSEIPLLGIYLKESKSGYNKDTYTPIFIVALLTIAKL
jgi:hypothetical protein